jgi:hypothetical protein
MFQLIDADGIPDEWHFCDDCQKWLKVGKSTGNIGKHVVSKHPAFLLQGEKSPPPSGFSKQNMLLWIVDESLPFRICESPWLTMMAGQIANRRQIATLLDRVKEQVAEMLCNELAQFTNIVLMTDEWSNASHDQFLGMMVHCTNAEHCIYRCLEHLPLGAERATAETLKRAIEDHLTNYAIKGKVMAMVTDTASVMQAAAAGAEIPWCPCWAHIINLMLGQIVSALKGDLEPLFAVAAAAQPFGPNVVVCGTKSRKSI